jgi:hypothetical protein
MNWYGFITTPGGTNRVVLGAAFAVHAWLLIFAVSIVIVQVLNSLRWAVSKTQWFLKRGGDHPFQAIGYVAAVLIVIITSLPSLLFQR